MRTRIWLAVLVLLLVFPAALNMYRSVPGDTLSGWTEDTRLTDVDDYTSTGARISVDSQNNLHLVWNDNRHGPTELYYMKLDSAGEIVVDELPVTSHDSAGSSLGDVACDPDGNIHIVWSDIRDTGAIPNMELYYKKLDNAGNTVVDETRITFAPYYSQYASIFADPSGNIHIAWVEKIIGISAIQEEIYYKKLDNDGNIVIDDVALTAQDGEESLFPDIAMDSEGNIHVVWLDDRNETGGQKCQDIYYTKLDGGGNTIVEDKNIFVYGDFHRPNMVIDSEDFIHMAFSCIPARVGNAFRQLYYMKLDSDGEQVGNLMRLTGDVANATHPEIVLDSNENMHIVWEDERWKEEEAQNSEIYYLKLGRSGNVLVDELRLTENSSASILPQIVMDQENRLKVVWGDTRDYPDGSAYEVYGKYRHNGSLNNPPTIVITNPSQGELISGTVVIEGTAADSDSQVQRVDVRIDDGTWITAQGTESWSIPWDSTTVENGIHSIWARSYDGLDYSLELEISVNVSNNQGNVPPTVEISQPHDGATISGTVQLAGEADDPDGTVLFVEIRIDDGSWNVTTGTTSWTHNWDSTLAQDGIHTLYARSYDGQDYSPEVWVNVSVQNIPPNAPPTISITSPTDGSELSGTVAVQGISSDPDGNVKKVEVRIDDGGWNSATGTVSWTFVWDTTLLDDGDHVLHARARDDSHEYSPEKSITVNVDNTGNSLPEVRIIWPTGGSVHGLVVVQGKAWDADGNDTIEWIQVNTGAGWQDADGILDWSYQWNTTNLNDGDYEVQARAFDGTDFSQIESVGVRVDNPHPPTIIVFTEIPRKVSDTFTIRGMASDTDGQIEKVEIQIDDGGWELISNSDDWSYDLDTDALDDGKHTVNIMVTDDEGEIAVESLTLEVDNSKDLSMWIVVVIVMIIIVLAIFIAAQRLFARAGGTRGLGGDYSSIESQLNITRCSQCESLFEADISSPYLQCPYCGFLRNA
jgi:hypothetical protein